jgi:hypothetical protein
MAAPILCNGPDGGPAAVIITMLADGDTVGLCGPCLTDWAHAIVKATAPQLLADAPKTAARRPRTKRPAGTPVTAVLGEDGRDSGVTLIGDKVVDGAS